MTDKKKKGMKKKTKKELYYEKWYKENRDARNKRRRERYAKDEDYRESEKARSAANYYESK